MEKLKEVLFARMLQALNESRLSEYGDIDDCILLACERFTALMFAIVDCGFRDDFAIWVKSHE